MVENNLLIYKKFTELYYYSYNLLEKYPKSERFALTSQIKTCLSNILRYILFAQKVFDMHEKIKFLNYIDAELVYLRFVVRFSYYKKYISQNNYKTWSYKVAEIGKMLGGWIKSCQKE